MFVEQNQEPVTEETSSTLENNNSEEVSVDIASDNQHQNMVELKDYLAPELFNEIKSNRSFFMGKTAYIVQRLLNVLRWRNVQNNLIKRPYNIVPLHI